MWIKPLENHFSKIEVNRFFPFKKMNLKLSYVLWFLVNSRFSVSKINGFILLIQMLSVWKVHTTINYQVLFFPSRVSSSHCHQSLHVVACIDSEHGSILCPQYMVGWFPILFRIWFHQGTHSSQKLLINNLYFIVLISWLFFVLSKLIKFRAKVS